ncbi:hypothetical protein G3T14_21695 [Methylobacterium sp. BTF04]|uniref:hypothetical protein n=1 Tax=Methylobacterium sp. BTF04 TaxID=2708300 RepID=UPI0013D31EB7|nr:hypothetical protein [Methylobacterium sp. BTF04]NEU14696.1 hypothetical protein [Methylobacterium sp. BTF04]
MTNSEVFENLSAQLIARLADSWPKCLSIIPADFGLPEEDDGKGAADLWDQWSEVVLWMGREGLIRFEGPSNGTCGEPWFYDVELMTKGREMNFSHFPQSQIDIVAPDGSVRCSTKAILDSKLATIPDPNVVIFTGDEIRRKIPNGTEETFEVLDPTYHDKFGGIPAHFQVKIRRKGTFAPGTGGNYTIHVNGSNSRVNVNSTDNSNNRVGDDTVFRDLQVAVQNSGLDASDIAKLQSSIRDMQSAVGTPTFKSEYQDFIQGAATYMTIISPFIPALSALL